MADFAKNLAALRKSRQLTQLQLADMLDVQPRLIGRWERGQGKPQFDYIVKLADVLEVSFDTLLRGDKAAAPSTFEVRNKQLQELCKQVDQLDQNEQEVICYLMNLVIRNEQIKQIVSQQKGRAKKG